MAYVSLEEASRLTGKSRTTLYRLMKQGKLSKSQYGFDTAELLRVFGPFKTAESHDAPRVEQHSVSWDSHNAHREIVDMLKDQLREAAQREERLLGLLAEAQANVKMLTDQREQPPKETPQARPTRTWASWVPVVIVLVMLGYVAYTVIWKREAVILAPVEPTVTPTPTPPAAPSPGDQKEPWKPDSGG